MAPYNNIEIIDIVDGMKKGYQYYLQQKKQIYKSKLQKKQRLEGNDLFQY